MSELTITLKTLTPLWTGGVDQTCDRLHETGLIGSLRWWYEALVRGLGGYACDPTSESSELRCRFDTDAYDKARQKGASSTDSITQGTMAICPVCYLFGTTGWSRLFQIRAERVPTTSLHFVTTLRMNRGWLEQLFAGTSGNLGSAQVPFGRLELKFCARGRDELYGRGQVGLLLSLAAKYGGIGARLQHGFGQVDPEMPADMKSDGAFTALKAKLKAGTSRRSSGEFNSRNPFNFQNLITLVYTIPEGELTDFSTSRLIAGTKPPAATYLPCAFDLRYKGSGRWGMRRWLKEQQGWKESDDTGKLEELDQLLGPRSQWGRKADVRKIDENLRTASRVFFSMPYKKNVEDQDYELRVWAFWSRNLSNRLKAPDDLSNLCQEYMGYVLPKARLQSAKLGKQILEELEGGQRGI